MREIKEDHRNNTCSPNRTGRLLARAASRHGEMDEFFGFIDSGKDLVTPTVIRGLIHNIYRAKTNNGRWTHFLWDQTGMPVLGFSFIRDRQHQIAI